MTNREGTERSIAPYGDILGDSFETSGTGSVVFLEVGLSVGGGRVVGNRVDGKF